MTRPSKLWLVLLLLFASSGVAYGLLVPRTTVSAVEARIKEALPIGTPKAEVEAWIKSQSDIGFSSFIGEAGSERIVGMGAVIHNVGPRLWPIDSEIEIEFYLDGSDHLKGYFLRKNVLFI